MDYLINSKQVTDICNAIRERSGTSDNYRFSEIPDAIYSIPSGGGGDEDSISLDVNWQMSIGNNITNIANMYLYAKPLSINPMSGKSVVNMSRAFNYSNVTEAVCFPNVIDMSYAYDQCRYLITAACSDSVENMQNAYSSSINITKAVVGKNVKIMSGAYSRCYNMMIAACGDNVTDMVNAFYDCNKMNSPIAMGNNVINAAGAYAYCYNVIGEPISGNIKNMYRTYFDCRNITGCGNCGDTVTDGREAYRNCYNITSGYIGSETMYLASVYENCFNLKEIFINSSKLTNVYRMTSRCYSLEKIRINSTSTLSFTAAFDDLDNRSQVTNIDTPIVIELNPVYSKNIYDRLLQMYPQGSGTLGLGFKNNAGPGPDGNYYWSKEMYEGVECDFMHSSCRNIVIKPNYDM